MTLFRPPKDAERIDISGIDFKALDNRLLDDNGRIRLLSYRDYADIPPDHLRAWANLRGRYGLPTVELVNWLTDRIAGRSALEIGAGNGDLGYHLKIPMTDSYQQVEDLATQLVFASYGITPTRPPSEVEKEDGENAVRRRKPKVVVACYVTEKYRPDNTGGFGNYLGVRHDYVIERCETFILVGNKNIHGGSRAMRIPHEEYSFPWIVTRSKDQTLNRLWVWENRKR
jgi:hypothetical protein